MVESLESEMFISNPAYLIMSIPKYFIWINFLYQFIPHMARWATAMKERSRASDGEQLLRRLFPPFFPLPKF